MTRIKRKGIAGERELLHKFHSQGYWGMRAPASGAIKYPSPDLLVGNRQRKLALECKVTKGTKQYLTGKEIKELQEFASVFGAEPWVAIKFNQTLANKKQDNIGWYFLTLENLEKTNGENFVISLERAKWKGVGFEEVV